MDFQDYLGRTESARDHADPERVRRLAATLDHGTSPWRAGLLPPLGHWLCFQPDMRQSGIGSDGHPLRSDDGMLLNVDLPRRMWAGSHIRFLRDIPLGAPIVRTSTLAGATLKEGRSGRMLFVGVRHDISIEGDEVAIVEEQDIVYRGAEPPGTASVPSVAIEAASDPDAIVRSVKPDPVMLFRYSALTFNSHRIHYDRSYAREKEGYPSLVIHGPLTATLLLDHLSRHDPHARIERYAFRAMSPLFEGDTVSLALRRNGDQVDLRAIGPAGIAMTATASLVPD